NKARLIAQGHTQEKGIDYEEVFAPVARIEAIRLFLAYAPFMGFMVYQMDVKSAFLYGTIEEEVYVCQPRRFKDLDYPDKVYKVVKELYGLHQAPKAWYETLANYLLENDFQLGKIDQTLFIKKQKGNILLVQVYVDEIIFGYTNKDLCKAFEKFIKDKFQMSSMGELTFFLGLQVKQKQDGIFISQDKYVAEILRKFGLIDRKSASTPIDTKKPLLKDPDGEDVDVYTYRRLSIPWMQINILAIQKQTFVATSSTEAEYVAVASCCAQVLWIQNQLLDYGRLSIPWMLINILAMQKQTFVATSSTEAEYVAAASCCAQVLWIQNQLLDYGKKVIITEDTVRQALQLDDAESIDCLPNEEIFIELARMGYEKPSTKLTFYKAFFSAQRKFLINTILQCMSAKRTAWNEFSSSMASAVICLATGVETPLFEGMLVPQQAGDDVSNVAAGDVAPTPPSSPIAQPSSPPQQQQPSHDTAISMDLLNTLLETYTTLTRKVEALEQDKVAQALEITKLKQRVRKLERKNKLKVLGLKRLRKVETTQRIETSADIDDLAGREKISIDKTYCCWYKLMLLDNAADLRLRLLEQSADVGVKRPTDKYSKVDQAKMLVGLINQRKKYFVKQKAKAKRKKPMTQAQQRTYMSNYIKQMGSYTLKQLKKLSFNEIKELFKATMRSIEDFVPTESEDDKAVPKLAVARSSKRDAEEELDQGKSKKQKIGESLELRNKDIDELS
nr:putative ribonuclease H-like domain-containing protein [Tanacetum cinerariifolium]